MARIVIYLHAKDLEHPSWIRIQEGFSVCTHHGNEQTLLEQYHVDDEVVAIVPAEDVLLCTVSLPPKLNLARLQQMVPYALEEWLIEEPEYLHFAIDCNTPSETLLVAVISHAKMQAWQALFKQWGITPHQWLPASFVFPTSPNSKQWNIVVIENSILLRTLHDTAICCSRENIRSYLDIALYETSEKPVQLDILNYTTHPISTMLSEWSKTNSIPCEEKVYPKNTFLEQIADASQNIEFNLLQGRYALQPFMTPLLKKLYYFVTYASILMISTILFAPLISYAILKYKIEATNQRILQQATYILLTKNKKSKNESPLSKKELQAQLLNRNNQLPNALLQLFAKIATGLHAVPSIQLEHLNYQKEQCTITLTAKNSQAVKLFLEKLIQEKLSVTQQHVTLTTPIIQATLLIEGFYNV